MEYLKNYLTRCQFLSRILHGKIIPGMNPKPRVDKLATPYAVSLPTAILQCDILYNNDIYINMNEGGGRGRGRGRQQPSSLNTQGLQRDLSEPFTNEVRRSELRIR